VSGPGSLGSPGSLVLVATPIGNLGDLSPRAVAALADADEIWCEDTRRTRTLLTHAGITGATLRSVQTHNEAGAAERLVERLAAGATIAYASDAGMPGVSDPGERLVAACIAADLPVTVVPGPTAALGALVVSGLPSARFAFEGFLPRKGPDRRAAIARIAAADATTIVYESPHRVSATLADLRAACGDERPAAVVRELTKLHETVVRGPLATLAARLDERVRGECVIVVGAAPPPEAVDDAAVDDAIRAELAAGSSPRDAAANVAASLGIAKRRAYDRALALRS
jgi:16S rRNA (cytidine1402-2'-O)-methyltransferase